MAHWLPRLIAACAFTASAFSQPCPIRHLAVFDANLVQISEERSFPLQPGPNRIDWRNLMPQAILGTLRIHGDSLSALRQDVTFDGPEARGQKTPVLHLVLDNSGPAATRKVRLDYLAPGLAWKADYSLVLAKKSLLLDGWVSVQNATGLDICGGVVDLIAGEIQLLTGSSTRDFSANAQAAYAPPPASEAYPRAEISAVSVFSRLRLGRDILLPSNSAMDRFPLTGRLSLPLEQRNVFENDYSTQTTGRGGFTLLPRGLEVRLVSTNSTPNPLPSGTVTIYSDDDEFPQIVGQDRIPLVPPGAAFSVTQGRSNTLQGTRRILDRRELSDPTARHGSKIIAQIEIILHNRGPAEETAFVREGIEHFSTGEWKLTESTHPAQRLSDRMLEFRLAVPPKQSLRLAYTVELR